MWPGFERPGHNTTMAPRLSLVFVLYHATRLNASIDLDRSAIDV